MNTVSPTTPYKFTGAMHTAYIYDEFLRCASQFTGKERDTETGLDYFGARYYGSNMGRFVTPDPMLMSAHAGNPQSWNRYTYTYNNPLAFVDPTGKEPVPSRLLLDLKRFYDRAYERLASYRTKPELLPNETARKAMEDLKRAGSDMSAYPAGIAAGQTLLTEAEKQIAGEIQIGFEKWLTDPGTNADDLESALLSLEGIEKEQEITIPQPFSWVAPGAINKTLWVLQNLAPGSQQTLINSLRLQILTAIKTQKSQPQNPEGKPKRNQKPPCLKDRNGTCVD